MTVEGKGEQRNAMRRHTGVEQKQKKDSVDGDKKRKQKQLR